MAPYPPQQLVTDWISWAEIASFQGKYSEPENPYIIAFDEMLWLVANSPDAAWSAILDILQLDPPAQVQALLAAGPIEDLLFLHGAEFIERIEREARANSKFSLLLEGVSQLETAPDVWERFVKLRGGGA
ncbi:DUF6869 domain-containing protein [Pseudomonas subflava]|uniref:DUF6869 domain-containing protein n=1 Tax=Pseudomonas subflava TaxID=2952933 RepID=UPI00207A2798|nr:hypothetical protein [Pseudomonas subflava]